MNLTKKAMAVVSVAAAIISSDCLGNDKEDFNKSITRIKEWSSTHGERKKEIDDRLVPLVNRILDQRDRLQAESRRLTDQRDNFQASNSYLAGECNRLRALADDRDRLQTLADERDHQIQALNISLTEYRDRFRVLADDYDSLQAEINRLSEELATLQAKNKRPPDKQPSPQVENTREPDKGVQSKSTSWVWWGVSAVTILIACFFKRILTLLLRLLERLNIRRPSPPKEPPLPAAAANVNPDKCPQCGTIRASGHPRCPNPKCGIRF